MQRRGIRLAVAAVIGVLIALAVREAMFDPRTVIYITDAPLIPAAPRPTLAELTAVLGPPADCYGKEPGKICFHFYNFSIFNNASAYLDETGRATRVGISTGAGLMVIDEFMRRLATNERRGRLRKRVDRAEPYSCKSDDVDEYDWLSIKYTEEHCVNSNPASIDITWR